MISGRVLSFSTAYVETSLLNDELQEKLYKMLLTENPINQFLMNAMKMYLRES
jgi:hypothetical protein